jgi:riboflavin biosynthesis pyrimidine reductase
MRPKIICQMTSSIDGRLLTSRWTKPAAGIDEKKLQGYYDQIYKTFDADGWLVGRITMEDYAKGKARSFDKPKANLRETFIGNRNGRNVAVVIDLKGKLHYGQDNADGDHIIAVLSDAVSDEYLTELQHDGVSYLLTSKDQTKSLHDALDILGDKFGIKTLVLQGGGATNGTFLKAGLIDEINVLIYPGIDGLAGMPSIFDYHGKADELPAGKQTLRHLATETLEGGTVWLRYELR